jgi:hypothetical protein
MFVLFLILKRNIFCLHYNIGYGFVVYVFSILKHASFVSRRFFTMNGCWILIKAFSATTEIIIWFSLSVYLYAVLFLNPHKLNHTSITGMKAAWSRYIILLMCCWICFPNIYWGIFCPCSSRSVVLFFVLFLSGLDIKVIMAF